MGDIWLPGLPPAHTNYAHLFKLTSIYWKHDDAVIMAAIPGNESGFDWRVINDTPSTGDYSVGLWQINYYDGLGPSRTKQFGTPRELIESGPDGQVQAAYALFLAAGGFSPWAADITNNLWQKWVGGGPVPGNPDLGGPNGTAPPLVTDDPLFSRVTKQLAKDDAAMVAQGQAFMAIGRAGWRP